MSLERARVENVSLRCEWCGFYYRRLVLGNFCSDVCALGLNRKNKEMYNAVFSTLTNRYRGGGSYHPSAAPPRINEDHQEYFSKVISVLYANESSIEAIQLRKFLQESEHIKEQDDDRAKKKVSFSDPIASSFASSSSSSSSHKRLSASPSFFSLEQAPIYCQDD